MIWRLNINDQSIQTIQSLESPSCAPRAVEMARFDSSLEKDGVIYWQFSRVLYVLLRHVFLLHAV